MKGSMYSIFLMILIFVLTLVNPIIGVNKLSIDDLKKDFVSPPSEASPSVWWHWMSGEVTKEGITKDLEAMKQVGIYEATIFDIGDAKNDGDGGGHIYDNGKNKLFSKEWDALIQYAMCEAKRLGIHLSAHNSPGWSGSGGPWVSPEDSMKIVTSRTLKISGGKAFEIKIEKPEHHFGYYKDTEFYRDIALFAIKGHNHQMLSPEEASGGIEIQSRSTALTDMDPQAAKEIKTEDIIDLSEKLKDDILVWEAPPGDWILVRIGYTTTGRKNRVARPDGEGLEVDKMDAAAVQRQFDNGLTGKLIELEAQIPKCRMTGFTIDSWEVGSQNWTKNFPHKFKKRRGYSIYKYLPVLAGFIVDSRDVSRRFLWDYRSTLAELIRDSYGATMHKLSNQQGKKLSIEPYGFGNFHSFDYGNQADYVMSEFWQGELDAVNIRAISSIAHITGKKEHRAEAFTSCYYNSGWRSHPWQLKAIGDQAFCRGINTLTIHTFAQNSLADNVVPGMSMGRWGMMLGRQQTWWPMAKDYMTYLSRCQYLLRQGIFAADLLYVTDEDTPKPDMDIVHESGQPCPDGYSYDVVSPDYFIRHAFVKNKQICFPSGISYSVVVLPKTQRVTVGFMRKIEALAQKGVIMLASDYTATPGLQGYPESNDVVQKINNKLNEISKSGKLPNYYHGKTLPDMLAAFEIKQDFTYQNLPADVKLNFIHQRLPYADIYFVANSAPKRIRSLCSFRVAEGTPMIWDPVTGQFNTIHVYDRKGARTDITLHLDKWQSVFVVFDLSEKKKKSHLIDLRWDHKTQDAAKPKLEILKAIEGYSYIPIPEVNKDITEKICEMVKDNQLYYKTDQMLVTHYKLNDEWCCSMHNVLDIQAGAPAASPMDAVIEDGKTGLVLKTADPGNYFIKQTNGKEQKITVEPYHNRLAVISPWKLTFQKNRGVDKSIMLDNLMNLSEHEDFNVQHFSGIITYETTIDVPQEFIDGSADVTIEFERISNMAQVFLNGTDCGVLWARPYTVNVSDALKAGSNKIVIKVANSWSNRLIGDEYYPTEFKQNSEGAMTESIPDWVYTGDLTQRPVKERIAFTTNRFYTKDDLLAPSGLEGQVIFKKWITVGINSQSL